MGRPDAPVLAAKGSMLPPGQGKGGYPGGPCTDAWGDAWATVHGLEGPHGGLRKAPSCAVPAQVGAPTHLVGYVSEQLHEAAQHRKSAGAAAADVPTLAEKRPGKRSKKSIHGCQSVAADALQGYEEQLHHPAYQTATVPSGGYLPLAYSQRPLQQHPSLPPTRATERPTCPHPASYSSAWGPDRGRAAGAAPTTHTKESKAEKKRRLHQHASVPLTSMPTLPTAPSMPHGGGGAGAGGAHHRGRDGASRGAAHDDGYPAHSGRPTHPMGARPTAWPAGPPSAYAALPPASGSPAGFPASAGYAGSKAAAGGGSGSYHPEGSKGQTGRQGRSHGQVGAQGQGKAKRRKSQAAGPPLVAATQQICLGKHYGYECPGCPGCRRM